MPHDFDEMRRQAAGEDIDYSATAHKAQGCTWEELLQSANPPKVQPGGSLHAQVVMTPHIATYPLHEEQIALMKSGRFAPRQLGGLPSGTTTGRTPSAHTPPMHQLPSDSPGVASVRAAMHSQRLGRAWDDHIATAMARLTAVHADKYMLERNPDGSYCLAVDAPSSSHGWATVRDYMTREQTVTLILALL